jgi:hypothetical protein
MIAGNKENDRQARRQEDRAACSRAFQQAHQTDRTARQAYWQGIIRGQEADNNTGWHAGSWTGKQVSNTAGTETGQAYMQGISRGQEVDKKTGWHAGSRTGMQVSNTAGTEAGQAYMQGIGRGQEADTNTG